jgi:hypothetical protein
MSSNEQIATVLVLTNMVKEKKLDVDNAMSLVMNVMKIINDSKLKIDDDMTMKMAKQFIHDVAKGPDGIIGTSDDIIPAKTLKEIDELLKSSIVDDVIKVCNELVKRRKLDTKRVLFCMSKFFAKH